MPCGTAEPRRTFDSPPPTQRDQNEGAMAVRRQPPPIPEIVGRPAGTAQIVEGRRQRRQRGREALQQGVGPAVFRASAREAALAVNRQNIHPGHTTSSPPSPPSTFQGRTPARIPPVRGRAGEAPKGMQKATSRARVEMEPPRAAEASPPRRARPGSSPHPPGRRAGKTTRVTCSSCVRRNR
jgi:hypothetical protein